jgi:hypothetical protein
MSSTARARTTKQLVKDHIKASKKATVSILKDKASAKAFLVRIGLLDSKGKRLTTS